MNQEIEVYSPETALRLAAALVGSGPMSVGQKVDLNRKVNLYRLAFARELVDVALQEISEDIEKATKPTPQEQAVELRDKEVQQRQRANKLQEELEQMVSISVDKNERLDELEARVLVQTEAANTFEKEINRLNRNLDTMHQAEGLLKGELDKKTKALEVQTKIASDMSAEVTRLKALGVFRTGEGHPDTPTTSEPPTLSPHEE